MVGRHLPVERREIDVEEVQGGQQAGPVGTLEVIQSAADAVVVEQGDLAGLEAQVLGDAAGGPGGHAVEGLAGQ